MSSASPTELRKAFSSFATGVTVITTSGLAMLPDCVAHFECETIAVHPGGDHRIIVARIVSMEHHEERDPLVFSRSQFMGLCLPEQAPIQ